MSVSSTSARVLAGCLLAGAFVVAACGGADSPATTSSSAPVTLTTTTVAPTTTVPPVTTTTTTTTTTTQAQAIAPPPAVPVQPPVAQPPAAAPPASPLTCSASMSNGSPSHNETTDVEVATGVSGASVTATAHYKTKDTTHTVSAGGGNAVVPFDISDATYGYTVDVDVTVSADGATQSCSTSFTPEA